MYLINKNIELKIPGEKLKKYINDYRNHLFNSSKYNVLDNPIALGIGWFTWNISSAIGKIYKNIIWKDNFERNRLHRDLS